MPAGSLVRRVARGDVLSGLVVVLPGDDAFARAERAGFDVVVVDVIDGPFDEVALRRLVAAGRRSEIGVVAVADESIAVARLRACGVDGVATGRQGRLQFADDVSCALIIVGGAADARRRTATAPAVVALDLGMALDDVLSRFTTASSSGEIAVPLVLLPGMLGDARVYDVVVAALPGTVSCRPARIDLDDSIEAMAESVLATAPPRFALAGHSLGGIVALQICHRDPTRVARLALLNASGRPPSEAQLSAWAELRDRTEGGEFATVAGEQAALNVGANGDGALVERCIEMAKRVGPDGFLRQLRAQASRPDSRPLLPRISIPTMVISGAEDTVCPPVLQREIAEAIPDASQVIIDGAGHMTPLDHGAEVAAHLADWLQR